MKLKREDRNEEERKGQEKVGGREREEKEKEMEDWGEGWFTFFDIAVHKKQWGLSVREKGQEMGGVERE